ncbi:hypothetical protein [Methylobacterium sp. OT2]|uniref:hypothetical protein n=1 Tax=Methylobacterium sp. OT2 TaxID=2813779 RepID=UPI00197C61B5|nr:hypothetical protein [Methylobacterium sp. OT2]MBN4096083.1 hypothetical protein [Methylobacterium sp. OT2]
MRPAFAAVLLADLTAAAVAAPATEHWSATSRTATAITGDIALSPTKLVAAGKTIPLAVAADVGAFGTSGGPKPARIMRVTREINPVLLRGNTLCSPAARWIALYRRDAGKGLTLAVFSGEAQPRGEDDPSLCATYYYTR